ncbi:MAG: hypothetical protein RR139_02385 [Lachnospiraceae bacterium]
MKIRSKLIITAAVAILTAMTLTGCATKEEKEKAAKFQSEAENYMAGNNYEAATASMKKALEQNPKDKDLQAAAEKLKKKAEKMSGYTKTMQAAISAIEADDAQTLNNLQISKEGKELMELIGNEGSYLYFPNGGNSGKGIGFYSFPNCTCDQWYYGDYTEGSREGNGIWYFVNNNTDDGSLYKEVYTGQWSGDKPNGTGHQLIASGENIYTNQDYQVIDGLFDGNYPINDTLADGTAVTGNYTLTKGKYVVITDEELTANSFAIPEQPHLAISFLYDVTGAIRSCTMVYAENVTEGVSHFR